MSQPRPRGTATYTKPALTEGQLVGRWVGRGLGVPDPSRAARYIRHIGYYRLSAYARSFEGPARDKFATGAEFDDILSLYNFDRQLRLLTLDAIERVEVAIRAAIDDELAVNYGPHWYEDASHFRGKSGNTTLLKEVDKIIAAQLQRRAEPVRQNLQHGFRTSLEYYLTTYGQPVRPPSWIVFEELSLGLLRNVYDSLEAAGIRNRIAKAIGLTDPVLRSWLLSWQRVRNICAHHARLWNRGLGVSPVIPKSKDIAWLSDRMLYSGNDAVTVHRRQSLYPVLISLQSVLCTIAPHATWGERLHQLVEGYPNVPIAAMGMPTSWFDDPFWHRNEGNS